MPISDRVLVSHPDAAWLPEGGRADVVLSRPDSAPPSPTCGVRLLTTRRNVILTVPRPGGAGVDIPTMHLHDLTVGAGLRALMVEALGAVRPVSLLGYVRNIVSDAPADYPWPSPEAHFAVWHCAAPGASDAGVGWVARAEAAALLGDRHWWPLADHLPG